MGINMAPQEQSVIVAFSFGSGAAEEAARAKNEMNLDIKLKRERTNRRDDRLQLWLAVIATTSVIVSIVAVFK